MSKQNLFLSIVAVSLATCLPQWGQERFEFDPRPGGAAQGEEPRTVFLNLKSLVQSRIFDPQAAEVFGMLDRCTRSQFNLPGLRLEKRVAFRDAAGDTIVAVWQFDLNGASGTVVVEDNPFSSQYAIHVAGARLSSKEALRDVLMVLSNVPSPPVDVWGLKLAVHTAANGSTRLAAHRLGSAVSDVHSYDFDGAAYPDGWYGVFRIGKGLIRSCYSEPTFVAERFPALSALVKVWSGPQLWSQIGAVYSYPLARMYSGERERIIIAELARRGLSAGDVTKLLRIDAPNGLASRALVVTSALEGVRPEWAKDVLGPAMVMYQQIGPKAQLAAINVFGTAALHCDEDTETVAAGLLRSPVVGSGAAGYLMRCSNSLETAAELRKMVESGELAAPNRYAVADMEKRIARGDAARGR